VCAHQRYPRYHSSRCARTVGHLSVGRDLYHYLDVSLVPDVSLCIGNRRRRSHGILSEIDADDDKHRNKDPDEPSNDVDAPAHSIEMPYSVDTMCNSGSLTETKP